LGSPESISLPNWQWYGGYNDRFAICGSDSYLGYTNRINLISEYLKKKSGPLPAERFLKYSMHKRNISLKFCTLRASRVRANGLTVAENFNPASLGKRLRRSIQKYWESKDSST
jgi:hypothetical protein